MAFNPINSIQYRLKKLKALPDYWKNRQNILFVYTLGKVGSSSLFSTLREHYPYHRVLKAHFVSDKMLSHMRQNNDNPLYPKNVELGDNVRDYLSDHSGKRIKIISLVRDPVARQVSDLFQNWSWHFGERTKEEVSEQEIMDVLESNNFGFPQRWLEEEFKWYTGIDIFEHPFDKEAGYSIIHGEKMDVLTIKLEKLSGCFQPALKEFLQLNVRTLINDNITEQSGKSDINKTVKAKFKLRRERLDQIYSTAYINHFYTEKEKEGFVNRWSKPVNKQSV